VPNQRARAAVAGAATGANADPGDTPAAPPPATIPGIIDAARAARREVDVLIRAGEFGAIWVPAFTARDLVLALEPHVNHLPVTRQDAAGTAIVQLVRAAWLLDAVGDGGNRTDINGALAQFAGALDAVEAAFAP
jgi:hypothetical protein